MEREPLIVAAAAPARARPPEWLRSLSEVLLFRGGVVAAGGDDADADAGESFLASSLPVCARDCTDGVLFYRVLSAWCVPWANVPLEPFLAAWFALAADTRRAQLQERKAFAAELDVDRWMENLLGRDDADMLAAALPHAGSAAAVVTECIRRGAVRCLTWVAHHKRWRASWARRCRRRSTLLACTRAAERGHLAMLRLLREHDCPWSQETCDRAAAGGHLACLAFLHERGCPWNAAACAVAAAGGHLACLAFLHERGCPWDAAACAVAAAGGHLACLAFLHERGCPWDAAATCAAAAQGGHLACLAFLHERGCLWDERTCAAAAAGGHLACIAYALDRGCPRDEEATLCAKAAARGQLACLVYLREERGFAWNEAACASAARNGHLACLVYLHEHGCPWNEAACASAARNGHLACLVYLHERGCPWNEAACVDAAHAGQLTCLTYLHEHGCPWDARTCDWTDTDGACHQYARAHGCPWTPPPDSSSSLLLHIDHVFLDSDERRQLLLETP